MYFYGCWALIAELSTPFVNMRWFLFQMKKNKSSLFRVSLETVEVVNGICLWLAFLVCRIIMFPFILYHMYANASLVLATHAIVHVPVIFGALTTLLLSILWFQKITVGLVKRLSQKPKQHTK